MSGWVERFSPLRGKAYYVHWAMSALEPDNDNSVDISGAGIVRLAGQLRLDQDFVVATIHRMFAYGLIVACADCGLERKEAGHRLAWPARYESRKR